MADERVWPMIVLLLDRVRRVAVDDVRRIVQAEQGDDAATTMRVVGENGAGMQYIEWRFGDTRYHIGTSDEPYIQLAGVADVDRETGRVGEFKWTMREELPPESEAECGAWMSHAAWMYVDALLFRPLPSATDDPHFRHVLRIAGQLVDERCVLLWLWGPERDPKRVLIPTPDVVAALRRGVWRE